MTDITADQVLDKAATLIEPKGKWTTDHHWSTGENVPPQDAFCLVDAIIASHPEGDIAVARSELFTQAYLDGKLIGSGSPMISAWSQLNNPSPGKIGFALMSAIGPTCKGFPYGLAEWNDAPGRTQAEVVSVLRNAAQSLRNELGMVSGDSHKAAP